MVLKENKKPIVNDIDLSLEDLKIVNVIRKTMKHYQDADEDKVDTYLSMLSQRYYRRYIVYDIMARFLNTVYENELSDEDKEDLIDVTSTKLWVTFCGGEIETEGENDDDRNVIGSLISVIKVLLECFMTNVENYRENPDVNQYIDHESFYQRYVINTFESYNFGEKGLSELVKFIVDTMGFNNNPLLNPLINFAFTKEEESDKDG